MRNIKSASTAPEVAVRKVVYSLGFRYRLHARDLPGRPDLVFRAQKKAIFVHGCFWHQHRDCVDGRAPKSNPSYWGPKLRRNVERDSENEAALKALGWKICKIWECEARDKGQVSRRVKSFLQR